MEDRNEPIEPRFTEVFNMLCKYADEEEEINKDADELLELIQDRFGLASLFLDQERYEEASIQLRSIECSERISSTVGLRRIARMTMLSGRPAGASWTSCQ